MKKITLADLLNLNTCCDSNVCLRFLSPFRIIISRKWQLENADLDMVDGDMEARESVPMTDEERLEEERYLMERAKETAETSHMTTSEQEETSSFVITGN